MAYFGMVRVNGRAAVQFSAGTITSPSVAVGQSNVGWYQGAADDMHAAITGTDIVRISAVGPIVNSGLGLFWGSAGVWSADTAINREAANTVKFYDGSTNASTVLLGSVDFRQTASTFAQTATITNGPRAANPVAWVEVKVAGSTGRVPVW